jgi:hypothetical protein
MVDRRTGKKKKSKKPVVKGPVNPNQQTPVTVPKRTGIPPKEIIDI